MWIRIPIRMAMDQTSEKRFRGSTFTLAAHHLLNDVLSRLDETEMMCEIAIILSHPRVARFFMESLCKSLQLTSFLGLPFHGNDRACECPRGGHQAARRPFLTASRAVLPCRIGVSLKIDPR